MFHSWSRRQLQSRSGCYHHFPFPGELDTHLPHALYPQESENILNWKGPTRILEFQLLGPAGPGT